MKHRVIINAFSAVLAITLLFGWVLTTAEAGTVTEDDVVRSSFAGGVLIDAVFRNPLQPETGDMLVWDLYLTTHSGDLSTLDFARLVSLQNDAGQHIDTGFQVSWEARSAHHPEVRLTLPLNAQVRQLINGSQRWIELLIKDVGTKDARTLRWQKEWLDSVAGRSDTQNYVAYVANAGDGTVSGVDLTSYRVVRTFKLGDEASHGVALSPDGKVLYAGSGGTGQVYAIDTATGNRTAVYETKANAHGIDRSPDGRWVIVSGRTDDIPNLTRIETATGRLTRLTSGVKPPSHADFSPDGRLLYVANLPTNTLSVIDGETMQEVRVIPVGESPNESRATPDGRWIFVANWASQDVSVIDTQTWTVVDTLKVGEGTHGVAVTPDGTEVWIVNRISRDVVVLDPITRDVTARMAAGHYANHLTFTPDGSRAVVTNARDNELMVFDVKSHELLAKIPVGQEPHEISIGRQ